MAPISSPRGTPLPAHPVGAQNSRSTIFLTAPVFANKTFGSWYLGLRVILPKRSNHPAYEDSLRVFAIFSSRVVEGLQMNGSRGFLSSSKPVHSPSGMSIRPPKCHTQHKFLVRCFLVGYQVSCALRCYLRGAEGLGPVQI